ncbi:MAG: aldolase/citrate lyase family protein [Steroidobacteraceae bacterium]
MNRARPRRPRRVQLSTPGSSETMMQKAAASNADHVFLDLEDAVAPNQKVAARAKIVHALTSLDWGRKTRCVRINDLTTEYAYDDVVEVVEGAGDCLDTLMMTKVTSASDIEFLDRLLTMLEKKHRLTRQIGIEALIEEVEGLQHVEEIAAAYAEAEAQGLGAVKVDGVMVDAATIRLLRASILDKGRLFGM